MQPTAVQVVVADDDADIRDLVRAQADPVRLRRPGLRQRGGRPRGDPPRPTGQLAVLDVMMPGLSGIDVLREIRADEALGGVRVVLLTARSRDTDVDMGFSTGADDYLIKPFSPRELVHRVAALVARPR